MAKEQEVRLRTPWAVRIFEMLADGDWHEIDVVMQAAAKPVPPEIAFRRWESIRQEPNKRPLGPGPRMRGDDGDSVRSGQRTIAWQTLHNHIRNGHIERAAGFVRAKSHAVLPSNSS